MTRFSVLMPTHNRADVLGYAIGSVLAQTETDFELLIVGDGCTDGTADVVGGFSDSRIRWFDLPKAPDFGYANRNIALREARGDLIAFAAHDDLLFPDHLALLSERMAEAGVDWAYSRPLFISRDGVVLPFGTNLLIDDERAYFRDKGNTIPASCVLHRRACFERVGYWPEEVRGGGDWVFWNRIIAGEARIGYLPVPTVFHFTAGWRNGRISGARFEAGVLAIADEASWWPESMRVAIPEGASEQAVFFDRMTEGGASWCTRFRADVQQALDRIAWDNVRVSRPALEARARDLELRTKDIAGLHNKAGERETEIGRLAGKLADAEASQKAGSDALRRRLQTRREKIRELRKRLRKATAARGWMRPWKA